MSIIISMSRIFLMGIFYYKNVSEVIRMIYMVMPVAIVNQCTLIVNMTMTVRLEFCFEDTINAFLGFRCPLPGSGSEPDVINCTGESK